MLVSAAWRLMRQGYAEAWGRMLHESVARVDAQAALPPRRRARVSTGDPQAPAACQREISIGSGLSSRSDRVTPPNSISVVRGWLYPGHRTGGISDLGFLDAGQRRATATTFLQTGCIVAWALAD